MNPGEKSHTAGFSLIEVLIAVGLVAVAIPSILGLFGYYSQISVNNQDREDASSVVSAIHIYLENEAANEAANGDSSSFATVYEWVYDARQDPEEATVLYAYKDRDNDSHFTVSVDPPDEDGDLDRIDGRILAVEIQAPDETVLPEADFVANWSEYRKAYLPLKMKIYALSASVEPRTGANFIDSFPVVLSR